MGGHLPSHTKSGARLAVAAVRNFLGNATCAYQMQSWHYFYYQRLSKTLWLPYNSKMLKKKKKWGLCFIVASVGKNEMLLPQRKIDSSSPSKSADSYNILYIKRAKFKNALKIYIYRWVSI